MVDFDQVTALRDIVINAPGAPPVRALPPEPKAGIPPELAEYVVDREEELSELREKLIRSRRVVIHGLGGVGKTQLAIAYLDQHRADYPGGAYWLRADLATTLMSDLASLAWRLRLPERELAEQELQIEAVLRWLREHDRWLLVVDNLDMPVVEATRHWLPPGLPGHLIVTSRSPQGPVRLRLAPLSVEVATLFLLDRTSADDAVAARAIAVAVGGLPLALQQAAAYLIENEWHSLAEYAELLRDRMTELLQEGKPEDYPLPVASTWDLSFQRVEQVQPVAADLLHLCAFLAPDDIPIAALQDGAGEVPEPLRSVLEDPIQRDRTIRTLRDYSLVESRADALRMHRLVQQVVRESLRAEQRLGWLAAAIRLLSRAFPSRADEPESFSICARLLPHAQAAVTLTGDRMLEPIVLGRLLDQMAAYMQARGDFAGSLPLSERAASIKEQVLGRDHLETARSLHYLGWALREQGKLSAATPPLKRALAIREQHLGPDHPDTAWSVNAVGLLLRARGELAESMLYIRRAVDIRERALGPEHPHTARSLNHLGWLHWEQGDLVAARTCLERALAIRERALGPEHPDTAWSLHNLGWVLAEEGDFARARGYLELALAIRERVLGLEHPETAWSLESVGSVLRELGQLDAAQSHIERAMTVRQRVQGPENPDMASTLDNLAKVLQARGELDAARAAAEEALALRERALGLGHPRTAISLLTVAGILQQQGDLDRTRALLQRALSIRERVLGTDHPRTVTVRRQLDMLR